MISLSAILYKVLFFVYRNLGWVLMLGFLLMLFYYMNGVVDQLQLQLKYSQAVYHSQNDEMQGLKKMLSQKENELGQQQTKVAAIVGEKETLKMMFEAQNSEFRQDLQNLGIELKQLQSVTKLSVTTSGEFTTVLQDTIYTRIEESKEGKLIKKDTIREQVTLINFKDKSGWFEMTGTITEKKKDSLMVKTMQFKPTFYEEYDVAVSYERVPKRFVLDFFPPKQTVATVFNKNPYTRTTGIKTIVKQKEKKKLFGIF